MNKRQSAGAWSAVILLGIGCGVFAARGEDAAAPAGKSITDGDVQIGPKYVAAPETKEVPGIPRGSLQHFTMDSSTSEIYPKDRDGNPFKRDVWVYIPSQYKPGTDAGLLVVQDGGGYRDVVSHSLDNLIAQQRLPVIVAVLINPGPKKERSFEYDTVSGDYCDFIDKEVLPKVEADYHVKFSGDPDERATMGGSSGGAAALTMGWFHPERYHLLLTYSGSFTKLHPTTDNPHGAWDYHERLIAATDSKPLRIYLEVGDNDIGAKRARKHVSQLGDRQPTHGRGPQSEGISLPFRLRRGSETCRSARCRSDVSGDDRLALGLSSEVSKRKDRRGQQRQNVSIH